MSLYYRAQSDLRSGKKHKTHFWQKKSLLLCLMISSVLVGCITYSNVKPVHRPAPVVSAEQRIPLPQKAQNANPVASPKTTPSQQKLTQPTQPVVSTAKPAPKNFKTKKITIKKGDTLATVFKRNHLSAKELQQLLKTNNANHLKKILPGQTLEIQVDDKNQLLSLQKNIDLTKTLIFTKQPNQAFTSKIQTKDLDKKIAYGTATIKGSLFASGKKANLSDTLIMRLASIFAYDIDFALDLRPQDSFEILYEELYLEGEKVGPGNILMAKFTNQGKVYEAIRFEDGHYYSPKGKSLKKAFIRTPVEYTRISSHFTEKRKHPILHNIRAHHGVDYAAPRGTPVKAAGKGKITFLGKKGGYGNTIVIQHGDKYSTLYAHLDSFKSKLKTGAKIEQEQIIGYVGKTGLATGPHLHYEFRVNGVHHNPLTVALPTAEDVPQAKKKSFLAHADQMQQMLDYQAKVMIASNATKNPKHG